MTMSMALHELLINYPYYYIWLPTVGSIESVTKLPGIKITGLNYHSQKVSENELFFCLTGYQYDGHDFAQIAYQNGASVLIVERVLSDIPLPQIVVTNTRHALSYLSATFYNYPSNSLTMIGITSTNGKTTTSYMIDRILSWNKPTGLLGTVMVKIGDDERSSGLTTPESLDLQMLLNKMHTESISCCTMEVSSAGLELDRVSSVNYDIAIVNNINRDHIDLHGSFANYFSAKQRLVKELSPQKFAILNMDCENTRKLTECTPSKTITYSLFGYPATVQVENLDLTSGHPNFTISVKESTPTLTGNFIEPIDFDISLKVLGLHNVYNATSAAIAGLICEEPLNVISERLGSFTGVERRFQLIYDRKFKILDDHFANSGNISVTLETLKQMKYKKLKIVYAIRGNRGITVNKENVETLLNYVDELNLDEIIVTSSSEFVSYEDVVTDKEREITMQLLKNAGIQVKYFDQLEFAINHIVNDVKMSDQDVVLLAGCQGMDHGARLILHALYEQMDPSERELYGKQVLAPLKDRIAGVNE